VIPLVTPEDEAFLTKVPPLYFALILAHFTRIIPSKEGLTQLQ
jgi:hypothetical protein